MIRHGLRLAKIGSTLLLLKTSLKNPLLLRQLEIALNKLIQNQPQTHAQLNALQGKVINIKLKGINVDWHLLVMEQQVLINPELHPQNAVTIEVNTLALPASLLNLNSKQPISFEGDFTAVLQLQGFSQALKLDLYPTLIQLFGGQVATMLVDIKDMIFAQANRLQSQLKAL